MRLLTVFLRVSVDVLSEMLWLQPGPYKNLPAKGFAKMDREEGSLRV